MSTRKRQPKKRQPKKATPKKVKKSGMSGNDIVMTILFLGSGGYLLLVKLWFAL